MNEKIGPARGLLMYPACPGTFHHARLPPSEALVRVVRHFWIVGWDLGHGPPHVRESLPHPNVHLVFEAAASRIQGVLTGRFKRVLKGKGCVVGVKFRAGGFRPFFGESVSELRDRSMDGARVFGSAIAVVAEEVFSHSDDAEMIAPIERFLLHQLPPPDPDADLAASIVETIEADRTLVRVDQLLERWRVSKRSLQRLFAEYVGVGPKWVINRYRLHEALEHLHSAAAVNWSELALNLGYFDQSHFIRDVRALIGKSPLQYARSVQGVAPREREVP